MAKISPTLEQWLIEMKFDHIDRKRVRFSDLDSISAEAWIRLAEWAKYNSAKIWAAYHSDPALGLERVAALASIEGIRPVSPSIIANSSSVMAILMDQTHAAAMVSNGIGNSHLGLHQNQAR